MRHPLSPFGLCPALFASALVTPVSEKDCPLVGARLEPRDKHPGKPAHKFLVMKLKPILFTLVIGIVAVAIVFRVTALRKAVTGATA